MSTINVTVKRASSLNVTVRSKQPINVTVDKTGATGLSAYEIWLAEGNTGTEQDFLDSLQGEPGEASDPTYSEFLFDSEATQDVNRFNDWADLMAAVASQYGQKRITFAHSEELPAGDWNLDDVILAGNGLAPAPGSPGALITLADGFKISSWRGAKLDNFCGLLSVSSEPIMLIDESFTIIADNGSVIVSMGASFFRATANIPSPQGESLRLDFRNGSFSVGAEQGFSSLVDTQGFTLNVATVISGINSRVGEGFIRGTAANWIGIVGDPAADGSSFEQPNPDFSGGKVIFTLPLATSVSVTEIEGLELEKNNVQLALEALAARPIGGGGVPDEPWPILNLDGKVLTALPISTAPQQPEGTICRIAYARVGRKVEGQGAITIPATVDWGTPDPYFPLSLMGLLSTDLPFKPRVYPVIAEMGSNTPNVGGFSIINTTEANGDAIPDNSMAIGSVITDFGGSLAVPLFLFFHAAQTNAGNLENLVFDGNEILLVGKNIVIYFDLKYEAAYELGYIGIADTLPTANENVAYSEPLAVTISSPLQLPLASAEVVAGALPDGISVALDGETLEFSGTPTVDGEYTFTIEVTGDNDDIGTQEITLTVSADEPPPYNPEDDPQYLGTVSGGSYNINFDNGDPSESIHTYVATAGEILKIRTSTLNYDFGEGAISVPVGEYIIYEGGYWRHYIYE